MNLTLASVADIASITTPVIGLSLWSWIRFKIWCKKRELESYLKEEREVGDDRGMRSVGQIMAEVGLTEAETLQASFDSCHIKRIVKSDDEWLVQKILFQYITEDDDEEEPLEVTSVGR